jgi:TonB family protein
VGGNRALMQFLARSIKYPAAAARANVEGMVFLTFEISKTGQVSNIKILKGIGFGCDEEAIRVTSLMPAWRPGRQNGKPVAVKYNLPIRFLLEKKAKNKLGANSIKNMEIEIDSMWIDPSERSNVKKIVISSSNSTMFGGKRPLYVVDGKVMKTDKDFEKLNPIDIMTMSVLKGEEATKVYGEEGRNGVVVIETKKARKYINSQLTPPDTKLKFNSDLLKENITYFVENEQITAEQMQKIKPEDIESVNVQKDKKGENSTVIITLKKKKE